MELIFSAGIIFALRLADQSLGTMRSLLVAKNKPIYAALIGLVESAIWIVAISQVIKDIDDPFLIGAYASGFAAGTILGSYIERLVGLGNIVVRVFSPADSPSVAEKLRENGHGVTVIDGQGKEICEQGHAQQSKPTMQAVTRTARHSSRDEQAMC